MKRLIRAAALLATLSAANSQDKAAFRLILIDPTPVPAE